MYWNAWPDFWSMGGYGLYVWGSFAVTAIVLGAELMLLTQRRRQALAEVRNQRLLHADDSGEFNDPPP
ncbi:MAG: heme exporter protein CcmD [Rubrivivax sp.]|nr:heme exporter protein CcmD [Rubrivivax sp.]MBK8527797.1 heme exporter protein CcmD [Rubrivivax sp.]